MAGAAAFQPEQVAGGDQHAAGQAAEEIQPAQGPVVEADEMQAGHEALHRHHRRGLEAVQQCAGAGVEKQLVQVHGDVVRVRAAQFDIAVGVARMPDAHEIRLAAMPLALGHLSHGIDRGQRAGQVGLGALVAAIGFGHEGAPGFFAAATVGRFMGLREIDGDKDDQARQGDQEVERQRRQAAEVVQVERAALQALARAKGKELRDDFLVDDDA